MQPLPSFADGEVFFAVCIVIIVIASLVYHTPPDHWPIPRQIWTYVPSHIQLLDPAVQRAMESWRRHHPAFRIHVLTDETYQGFVTSFPEPLNVMKRGPHHHPVFHDWFGSLLALYLLAEHGGVWMDPTTVLYRPLTEWLFPHPTQRLAGIATITAAHGHPAIQSTLIACRRYDPLMIAWRDEFTTAASFPSMDKYVAPEPILQTAPVTVASSRVLWIQERMYREKKDRPWILWEPETIGEWVRGYAS